jgi:SAM-dependent MidA family methyltransferase
MVYAMDSELSLSALGETIKNEIQQQPKGAISFYRWMELCLYHPTKGYYMKPGIKVGKQGDFYTVSSMGTIFAEQWVSTFIEMIALMETGTITLLEWGGGDGSLSGQMIQAWKKDASFSRMNLNWVMIETSPDHREKQMERLSGCGVKVRWISAMEELTVEEMQSIIVFSNELLDAFPVYRVKKIGGEIREIYVAWDEERHMFRNIFLAPRSELVDYLSDYHIELEEGQEAEINLDQDRWIKEVARHVYKGFIATIDYGDVTEDLYAPHQAEGTILGYYKHQTTKEVLTRPGEHDLTSHVHFTACMRKGEEAGLTTIGFLSQREFLLNSGILEKVKEHQDTDPFRSPAIRANRMIRQLMTPGIMGENFKVLIQSKGVENPHRLRCLQSYFG